MFWNLNQSYIFTTESMLIINDAQRIFLSHYVPSSSIATLQKLSNLKLANKKTIIFR